MTPSRFALLAFLTLVSGAVVGGFLGSRVPIDLIALNEREAIQRGSAPSTRDLTNNIAAYEYERERRQWQAGGTVVGATLGLGLAGIVGTYRARFRAS